MVLVCKWLSEKIVALLFIYDNCGFESRLSPKFLYPGNPTGRGMVLKQPLV